MAEPTRFYLDQHIPATAAQGLRQRGIDVLTAQDAGRCGLPDADQLQFALPEERVVVMFDADYLGLAASAVEHAGIAWCPATKMNHQDRIHLRLALIDEGVFPIA